ncbi:MAG: DUF4430 domain-containing protein [Finegoldia sp.]|nr:DUF4430 domain-containing protein [Finegoldia sp.]
MKKKKLMTKIFALFALATLTLTTACSNSSAPTVEKSATENTADQGASTDTQKQGTKIQIVINDTVNNKEILTEEVVLEEGQNLQKYLEENQGAVFENGMMTELKGIKQDNDKKQYWMYYVNGEMAQVGIGDYQAKENDKVEFKFEQM